jgi:hypothetical protein
MGFRRGIVGTVIWIALSLSFVIFAGVVTLVVLAATDRL